MKIAQSDPHAEKTLSTQSGEVGVISSTVTTRQCVVNMACPATSKLTLQITTSPGSYSTALPACLLSVHALTLRDVIKSRDVLKGC